MALARALISSPSLFLPDEPFSGLDRATRKQLWAHINLLKYEWIAIVFVTHEPKESDALAEYRIQIEDGKIRTTTMG